MPMLTLQSLSTSKWLTMMKMEDVLTKVIGVTRLL